MENLKEVYDRAFRLKDYILCMQIAQKAQNFKIDISGLEKAVIESGNALYALQYVRAMKPKDKKKFEDVIIKYGNANIACIYARENAGDCDVKAIENVVLNYGDSFDSANLVCEVKGCDVEKHKEKILDEGEAYACYLYAKKFQPVGKELKQFEDAVVDSEDAEVAYLFARDVYFADKNRLGRVVLENGSTEDIICYASMLANESLSDVKSFTSSDFDLVDLINFMNVSTVGTYMKLQEDMEQYIKTFGTFEDVADFLLFVQGADVVELQEIIENSDRTDLKLEIAKDKDVDLHSLTNSILNDKKDKLSFNVSMPSGCMER